MTRGVKKDKGDKADKAMPTYLVDSWGGSCGFTSDGIPEMSIDQGLFTNVDITWKPTFSQLGSSSITCYNG